MNEPVDERTLWEWVDSASPELDAHLARHPEDRERVDELRRVVAACREPSPIRGRPERVGRFRLIRRIGRGGMGVVYEAEQESPRRRVAVKLLSDAAFEDPVVRARLAREAQALGSIAHPHVATVFEHGESAEGEPYIAMELVDGVALDAWARERRSRRRVIVELIEKVARAVHHAHERGIVHRDLKPSNLLVDARGEPKVLDFGLAQLMSESATHGAALTTTGRVFGTLAYMSPEQARGASDGDARGDVYALGVILYEALAGALPYDLSARSLPEAARVIAEDAPRRLRKVVAGIDAELDVICGKALAKDPEQRYASALELADDLRRQLDGLPIRARRPSVVYRTRRFVRRNAGALAAAVVIACLGLFGLYAAALRVDLGPLQQITGDWYAEASPFDDLRWEGLVPIVKIDGGWYELVEIEGLHAGYVVGFCQQNAGNQWRRRFRDDLRQVLNRMGRWPLETVDLVVRDRASGQVRALAAVAFTKAKRQAVYRREGDGYFGDWRWTDDGIELEHEGRRWALESFDGVFARDLRSVANTMQPPGSPRLTSEIDAVFLRAVDRSPNEYVELVLRDEATGERLVIPRAARTHRSPNTLRPRELGVPVAERKDP